MGSVVNLGAGKGIGGQFAQTPQVRRGKYAGTACHPGTGSAVVVGRGDTGRQTAGMRPDGNKDKDEDEDEEEHVVGDFKR